MHRARAIVLCVLSVVLAPRSYAQAPADVRVPPRGEILVVGVYHMGNPGRDIFNMKADDVLSPKRQAEIGRLIEVLKAFAPTRIALERDAFDTRLGKDYADYVAGSRELTRNEIEQLGFRLGRELGHTTVYPVDADGDFPYPRLANHAKATGRSKELEEIMAGFGELSKAQGEFLATHTVLETLLFMNTDARVDAETALYHRLATIGEPGDWAGAELVSEWFGRNMRIYTNIVRLVESPGERVLVIYGAGHLGWLQRAIAANPTLRLRKLSELVKEPPGAAPR